MVLLQLLLNMQTTNAIRKKFFTTEKNKDLLTIKHKSVETKSFDGVTFINLAKDMDLIQEANYMVSKKSEKTFDPVEISLSKMSVLKPLLYKSISL